MNMIRELFVSYSQANDEAPVIRLVADWETLEVIKNSAPLFRRVGSSINVESINESDPIVNIVCVTDKSLRAGQPEAITDEVVTWLQNQGEWWT